MIRNLKALGLAVVAVLAMSALAASAAQAEGELTIEGGGVGTEVHVHGEQSALHTITLSAGRTLSCTIATFTGDSLNFATDATIIPTYSGCSAKVGESILPATVTMNSCDYLFTLKTKTAGPVWDAETHVKCATAGDHIQIHLYLNAEKHALNIPLCTYTIEPQTIEASKVQFSNMTGTPNDITINTINAPIAMHRTAGTLGNCGAVNGTFLYNGNTTVTGKVGGVATGISIS